MKYMILLCSFLFTMGNLKAQHLLSGWRAGLNTKIIKADFKDSDANKKFAENSHYGLGLDVGVFKDFTLNERLFIRTLGDYQLRTSKETKNKYFISSLNLRGHINYKLSNKVTVFGGLGFGYIFNALRNYEILRTNLDNPSGALGTIERTVNANHLFNAFEIQGELGFLHDIGEKWQFEFKFARGLNNLSELDDYTSRFQTFSFSIIKKIGSVTKE